MQIGVFLIPGTLHWASNGMGYAQALCPDLSKMAQAWSCKALYTASKPALPAIRFVGGFQNTGAPSHNAPHKLNNASIGVQY